ncbi:hypothetical protein CMESO_370 (nucleomorph) [Chroomonas mesostigmatica CCMP1168]|uniref:Uncharacterized protein n=1 Tax=Chroomonas mesostigmatica CCMP1168 TaxID=1195612 RepID=J7G648_9CRYP|nr:hypothetical protein CMESO_370 [Chroomonas mesostigmatica CCMP1168]
MSSYNDYEKKKKHFWWGRFIRNEFKKFLLRFLPLRHFKIKNSKNLSRKIFNRKKKFIDIKKENIDLLKFKKIYPTNLIDKWIGFRIRF